MCCGFSCSIDAFLSWPMFNSCRSVFVVFRSIQLFQLFQTVHTHYLSIIQTTIRFCCCLFSFDFHHSINQAICEEPKSHAIASCHPYRTAVRFRSSQTANETEIIRIMYTDKMASQQREGDAIYIPMKIYFYQAHANEKRPLMDKVLGLWRTFISISNHLIHLGHFAGCNHACRPISLSLNGATHNQFTSIEFNGQNELVAMPNGCAHFYT